MTAIVGALRALNPCALCLAISATLLGHAIQEGNGFYSDDALRWLIAALAFAVVGVLLHRVGGEWTRPGSVALCSLLTGGIAWQCYELMTSRPGMYIARGSITTFQIAVCLQALAVALGVLRIPRLGRIWFPAVMAAALFLGAWMIYASPNPHIDVVTVHKEALDALLHGNNPYRITLPNIYGNSAFYNPQAVFGDRVLIAYPYPPASLLLAIPGYVLLGDYRYSELALLVAAGGLIAYSRGGLGPKLAAALFLTTPRAWFVIEQGWTEPIAVFMLALSVFLLIRLPVSAAFATGLFTVTKQYCGFAGLVALRQVFMRPGTWWRGAIAGMAGAALTVLPFYLWRPSAFMRNVVYLQTLEPFRADSLSFLSWAARHGYGNGSYLWAIGAAVTAAVVTLLATRNTPSGFGASVAVTTFLMFVFGSKAFCNYYFFVVGALCCAIAAWPGPGEDDVVMASPHARTAARATTQ